MLQRAPTTAKRKSAILTPYFLCTNEDIKVSNLAMVHSNVD